MSSDEEDGPQLKKQRLFYGSLEDQERERILREEKAAQELLRAQGSESSEESSDDEDSKKKKKKRKKKNKESDGESDSDEDTAVDRAMKAGNINIGDVETMEMTPDAKAEHQQELMAQFEKRKIIKSITVSTDDKAVKARLRELGHPICLFGEGPAQRRDRLRDLLSVFEQLLPGFTATKEDSEEEEEADAPEEVWYHEGTDELKASRLFMAKYSVPRARDRLIQAKKDLKMPETEKLKKSQEVQRKMRALINFCSQIGDNRPLSYCNLSPNGKLLATGSWSGLCKLWSLPDGNEVRTLKGHNERVGAIVFHPQSTISLESSAANMVSCGVDGVVQLWNLEDDAPIGKIEGHEERVSSLAFHPSGRFLGTSCFDKSWRLWDLEQQTEVLHQEGHGKEVYKICFQQDGALAVTGGYDARGLVWDLRTGRNVFSLDGHLKRVLAVDFHSNGYQVATGSEDQKCMIWDLRQQKSIYTIPAHNNLISHLKFCNNFLVTASFDGEAKVWSYPTWTPLQTLSGHEQKVTCVDVTQDENFIVTTSFDRTFKLWGPEFLV